MKSPTLLLVEAFISDFKRLHPEVNGLDRDLVTIEDRVENEGDSFLLVTLPRLAEHLEEALQEGVFHRNLSFRRKRGSSLPAFLHGLTERIFDSYSGKLLEKPDVEALLTLRQLLRLYKKAMVKPAAKEKLVRKAVASFYENDKTKTNLSPRLADLIGKVAKLVLWDLDIESECQKLVGRHGPGAVYEKLSVNKKYDRLYRGIRHDHPVIAELAYETSGIVQQHNSDIESCIFGDELPRDLISNHVRLIDVPKNTTAVRLITVEPTLNQFVQQSMNSALRASIARCPILSKVLTLHDQSGNQKLALIGSYNGSYGTIDLSAASDRLSLDLVERCFESKPKTLELLKSCRTPMAILPDGSEFVMEKYAGMGNATTFPVQSVVFAILALAAYCDADGKQPSYRRLLRYADELKCFGDDIIVATRVTTSVLNILGDAGLKINASKSFLKGNFRESCGCDAFLGVDVTPVYMRHVPKGTALSPSELASYVATSNLLWERCYYAAATFITRLVESQMKLPVVSSSSSALGWRDRWNRRTIERWNDALHRFEFRGKLIRNRKVQDELNGYPALLKFFAVPFIGRAKDHLQKTEKRYSQSIATRWVASY